DRLALGDLTDVPLALFGEGHDLGRQPRAFLIHDDRLLPTFHHGHARVGGAEVDSNHFAWHLLIPRFLQSFRKYRNVMSACQAYYLSICYSCLNHTWTTAIVR